MHYMWLKLEFRLRLTLTLLWLKCSDLGKLVKLKSCLSDIKFQSYVKFNDDKTEVSLVSTPNTLSSLGANFGNLPDNITQAARDLGVILNANLCFDIQVKNVRLCFFHLMIIFKIRLFYLLLILKKWYMLLSNLPLITVMRFIVLPARTRWTISCWSKMLMLVSLLGQKGMSTLPLCLPPYTGAKLVFTLILKYYSPFRC